MKPFNLEEYLDNPSREIVTRDGRKVTKILCTDVKGKYPIVVVIENRDGNTERAISLTKDGKYIDGSSDNKDLFFATEKHEGWVSLYNCEEKYYPGMRVYSTKEEAVSSIKGLNLDRMVIAKVEWEE
ncbi:MAG: hypothetical protein SPF22_04145 [Candidatus Onthovivens sp.]|nr:hypothetical protein [Candidatus Onthovivens sp.]